MFFSATLKANGHDSSSHEPPPYLSRSCVIACRFFYCWLLTVGSRFFCCLPFFFFFLFLLSFCCCSCCFRFFLRTFPFFFQRSFVGARWISLIDVVSLISNRASLREREREKETRLFCIRLTLLRPSSHVTFPYKTNQKINWPAAAPATRSRQEHFLLLTILDTIAFFHVTQLQLLLVPSVCLSVSLSLSLLS